MNRTSRDLERRVFQLHFNGIPRDDIAHRLGIAPSTVTEILTVLPSEVAPLRELSKDLRKNEMDPRDALMGVEIMKELKALGSGPERFSSCLQAVLKMSSDARYKPERVLQGAYKLVELEDEAGKSYSEVLQDFEVVNQKTRRRKQESSRLELKNSVLRAQIRDNEERAARTFEAAEVAPEEISRFKEQEKKLRQNGLSFDDVDIVVNVLENVREMNGDVGRLVKAVGTRGSLISKIANLGKKLRKAERDFSRSEAEKSRVELELMRLRGLESYLSDQIRSNNHTLAVQYQEIRSRQTQLSRIRYEYEKVDALRREAIRKTGRMLGMNEMDVWSLQAEANFELVYDALNRRVEAFLEQLQKNILQKIKS